MGVGVAGGVGVEPRPRSQPENRYLDGVGVVQKNRNFFLKLNHKILHNFREKYRSFWGRKMACGTILTLFRQKMKILRGRGWSEKIGIFLNNFLAWF